MKNIVLFACNLIVLMTMLSSCGGTQNETNSEYSLSIDSSKIDSIQQLKTVVSASRDTLEINGVAKDTRQKSGKYSVGKGVAVDLGLSVKWAACNLGATKPEGYGSYYAWGETKPKATYTTDNSKWDDVAYDVLKSKGIINSRGNLTSRYDAATANWGAGWRMPTLDEIKELENRCRWSWTTMNGVKGYKVTGPSGKSIFLPAADYVGGYGDYWSSSAFDNSFSAYHLYFNSGYYVWDPSFNRYYGRSVRPISE